LKTNKVHCQSPASALDAGLLRTVYRSPALKKKPGFVLFGERSEL
jgi:hypothetical protein